MPLTTVSSGMLDSTAQYYSFKNRIINGAMVIDQRNNGASVTIGATTGTYTLDRWCAQSISASKFSVQRNAGSITPPAGFANYLGITSLATTSSGSTDYYSLFQVVEGFNSADFAWGTASAQTVTVSFWVQSSLTGTHSASLANSGASRSYPFSFVINAANTWEQKTITVAGDTSGTWLTTNVIGIYLRFDLGCGSTFRGTSGSWAAANYYGATGAVNLVATNGATFYITGVQLEKGSTATSFDYRPYGTELQLCQRYFETSISTTTAGVSVGSGYFSTIPFKTSKRATPTITVISNLTGTLDSIGVVTSEYASGSHTTSGAVARSTVSISIEL